MNNQDDCEIEQRKKFIEDFCGCITIPNEEESSLDEDINKIENIWEKHIDIE